MNPISKRWLNMTHLHMLLFFLAMLLLLTAVSCRVAGDVAKEDHRMRMGEQMAALHEKAEKGDIHAQALLGFAYYRGNGVSQDYAQAHTWFHKAAKQGSAFAQLGLGTMYSAGSGVPKDDEEAAMWYEKAAEQGSVGCQYRIGAMYSEGRGVEQCYIQAYKWLSLAAMKKVTKAATLRDALALEMTSDQIAEAQKLLQEWLVKHGESLTAPSETDLRRYP